ncbi:MAG: glycoside hydrolase family 13 protein [Actinomycetales bacterium]
MTSSAPGAAAADNDSAWWRSAVIYQIYPRSFADSNGDGMGDLPGITDKLEYLAELGVDAVWLSPFYASPQADAGYDVADYRDIDPTFGTLADADALIERAHGLGLRVIVDLVPNHTSDEHEWFPAAIAAGPNSLERNRYHFRDGRGADGDQPPNNWKSVFGGPAWERITEPDGSPGQWYLHLFDVKQPDLNWENPQVREEFHAILRFWLDRGVDGFRVDVAHGLVKAEGLPDSKTGDDPDLLHGDHDPFEREPFWDQDGVHEIYRGWNAVLSEYSGDRMMVAEAWVQPAERLALYLRHDEFHQAFNFPYLESRWSPTVQRSVIASSLAADAVVGSPTTWVLSNHDVVRHRTRLALPADAGRPNGIGPDDPQPDQELGLRRARAATLMMLALPGSAYVYQGEELGLPEHTTLPDEARQDPTFFRHHGTVKGRDGCRVPMPWRSGEPGLGFGPSDKTWLPQPASYAQLAADAQDGQDGSTLELYRAALRLRREYRLGLGDLHWRDEFGPEVVAFDRAPVSSLTNFGATAVDLPEGARVVLASGDLVDGKVGQDQTVWFTRD